ncbi:MAG TPA: ribosome silencing factor [Bacteroidia bacterium]|nr:ribosome silencing factor [Bacteroidia bacterium]
MANLENKKKTSTRRPKKSSSPKQTSTLLDSVVEGMQERKAKNIVILNLSEIENRVTDYFVICDADSNTHVNSIADSIEDTVLKLTGEKAYHTEGRQNGEWILIDYINIVAHVFLREAREHYNIEGLWGDAQITNVED